jgi:long-chain fatty acid transport protein
LNKSITTAVLAALGQLALSYPVWGAGFALIENSASGLGSAYAGAAALGEDPSTVWFNPAAMNLLADQQVAVVLHAIKPTASYTDEGSYVNPKLTGGVVPYSLTGSNDTTSTLGIVPNLYYVVPFQERWRFGLGINVPFGLETSYDDDWVGRYHALNSKIETININPALSWEASNNLSLGFGVNIQYLKAELSRKIDSSYVCLGIAGTDPTLRAECVSSGLYIPSNAATDSAGKVNADNWAMGYNLGLLYRFNESARIGLTYRSEISHSVDGDGEFDVYPALREFLDRPDVGLNTLFTDSGVSAEADLPASASLSGVFSVNDQLSLLADITWTGWSSFPELRYVYDNPVQPDSVTEESWEDSMRYSLGLNYREGPRIWRMGVAYDETPIPDPQHRIPRIPGNDRTWLALGVGLPVTETIWLDLGYAHLFVDDMAIDHADQAGYTLSGIYEADVDILSIQATMKL